MTRLEISEGDWLLVKSGLDTADQRKMSALAVKTIRLPDGAVVDRVDWSLYELLRTDLWLVDWSLTKPDKDGTPVKVEKSLESLKALDPPDFDEINDKVYEHMLEWRRKKFPSEKETTPPPAGSSSPTSS
jgi:hypothetical protein